MRRLVLFASAFLLLVSCTTLYVKAPSGKTVTLLANEPTTVKMEFRQVSWLWGLMPIANQPINTATWCKSVNLGQLRVKTYYKWYEFLWNIPGSVLLGFHSNTVLLEGNPRQVKQ